MIIEINKGLFAEYAQSGKGPVYMDCRGISENDYKYMMRWFEHEGFIALTDHLHAKGIDLRKNPIEWATYGMRGSCGSIWQDLNGQTSMKGLYVAGDETTRSISPAATFGWIAGEHAAKRAARVQESMSKKVRELIKEKRSFLNEIICRETGPDWKEANIALQQIMSEYAGSIRSESLLEAGHRHLRRLRQEVRETITAGNPHELSRVLEVLNLIDLGELVCIAAKQRKETRGQHRRTDYAYTNPTMDQYLIVKNIGGQPVTEWR